MTALDGLSVLVWRGAVAAARNEAGGRQDRCRRFGGRAQLGRQHLGDPLAAGLGIVVEGAEARLGVGRDGQVVEADDGQLTGHGDAQLGGGLQQAERELVDDAQDRRRPRFDRQNPTAGGAQGVAVAARRRHDPVRGQGQAGALERLLQAAAAVVGEAEGLLDRQKAETAMPEPDQQLGGLGEGALAVAVVPEVRPCLAGGAAVADERKALVDQEADPRVFQLGPGQHDAVGTAALDDVPDHLDLVLAARDGGDEEIALAARQAFAQTGDEGAQEGVDEGGIAGRDHQADGVGRAGDQHASGPARHVAQLARLAADALLRARADVVVAGERPGHRGDRQAECLRQVFEARLAPCGFHFLASETFRFAAKPLPKRFGKLVTNLDGASRVRFPVRSAGPCTRRAKRGRPLARASLGTASQGDSA